MRKPRIIQVAILAQTLDNRLDDGLSRATTFAQSLSQFFDRAWLSGKEFASALEDAFSSFCRIERRR